MTTQKISIIRGQAEYLHLGGPKIATSHSLESHVSEEVHQRGLAEREGEEAKG